MKEAVLSSVAWRRRHTTHYYVGRLSASDEGLRLDGHEPSTGIDVSLSIPFSELEEVVAPNGSGDLVSGEPAVILRLLGSEPLLVRDAAADREQTVALAHDLARLLECGRRRGGRG